MATSPQESGAGDQAVGASGPVLINDQFLIDVNAPISELDMPSAKAYAARDRRNQEIELYALVCTPGMPVRTDFIQKMKNERHVGMVQVITWEVAFWPPINQETIFVIYERPLGGNVHDAILSGEFTANEYIIQEMFIEPIFRAIKEMAMHNVHHREIRINNLFFTDKERTLIGIGDCTTSPPGFDQPILYETVERGMAAPGGRGSGSISDDLYALGVTMVALILGKRMVEYKSAEEMFRAKVEQGTYAALCGKRKIPVPLIEPLRGILSDDITERWGIDEMNMWVAGNRQTPMQRKPAIRTEAPFHFMEREYRNPRILAYAFSKNVPEAAKAIKGEELTIWLRRSVGNAELADMIEGVVASANINENETRGSDDYVVAKTTILMDPEGPIRYKGLSFIPEGYGTALAIELLRRNSMQTSAETILHGIPEIWYNAPTDKARDEASFDFQSVFGRLKAILVVNGPGFGIERCLYDLNPSLACQSSLIAEQCVVEIQDLLPALDAVADKTDKKLRPLDRHIAAFIAARFKERIDPHLRALAEPKDSSFLIGMLSLLAFLQWKLKGEPVYALTSWVGSLLGPAVKTYFSRATRRDIEEDMPRVVRQGNLPELFDLIDNAEKRRQDLAHYEEARFEYSMAEEQIQDIEKGELSSPEAPVEMGQKFAAMSSLVISIIVVSILVVAEIW